MPPSALPSRQPTEPGSLRRVALAAATATVLLLLLAPSPAAAHFHEDLPLVGGGHCPDGYFQAVPTPDYWVCCPNPPEQATLESLVTWARSLKGRCVQH